MNFLILGDGVEEHAWAMAIEREAAHQVRAAYPGFDDLTDVPRPRDFDDALAMAGVEAVLVGGDHEVRVEWLRRVAAVGLPAICLHPPGDDSEAYYQVALSRAETGAVLVPDLPARLHPGVTVLRRALADGDLGAFRGIRHESSAEPGDGDLTRHLFSRIVDLVRSLLGEVEAVTGTGDPPGQRPDQSLVVQLRGPEARRAEVRIVAGPAEPARLIVSGDQGSLTLEYEPTFKKQARLIRRTSGGEQSVTELVPWDPHVAILAVLEQSMAGSDARPNLLDGTRAMELAEATARSLRRGRTVDLHYEEISEAGNFKSVMTSTGCMLLLGIMVALPAALAGPALGWNWTLYIAYAIPPLLVLFMLMQSLRFAVRESKPTTAESPER
ncbi:Gfo/Idh/MocA family oxidoreductase [Singulisphaera sp. Ch08]|uniref:Gfo/Idh/MocA family oxidoreductase n=1 Tax=Singulisphaera sp. Ch08 TaxID=3120278 RepID=A0AAU7CH36_9BACT